MLTLSSKCGGITGQRLAPCPAQRARLPVQRQAPRLHSQHSPQQPADALNAITGRLQQAALNLGKALFAAGAAATLVLGAAAPPADAEAVLRFPVAKEKQLYEIQKTLVEAWSIVTETYVDQSYNGTEWDEELVAALTSVAQAPSVEEARTQIPAMLGKLGDPFTRWLPQKQYQDFRIGNDGALQGVGMLIASDPQSGRMVVLAPIKGSPADQAGIQPGDELLNVDGTSISGLDTDGVAAKLRGQEGSSVWIKVARRRTEIPGVAGLPAEGPAVEYKQFRLRRAQVELNPVFATTMMMDDHTYGYVRLTSFSQHSPDDMQHAISQLKRDGVEGFILDLRNNPGGLVNAALDIASLWLDGPASVFNVQDGESLESVGLTEASSAATDLPLVVLVNKNSASASEILAGALHDNHRAEVLGESTYGKGKIQSVFELADGSAVFVTVAKYKTPAGSEIDQIGVQPDRACSPLGSGEGARLSSSGIPVGPGASEMVIEELATDDCVLTAESLLEKRVEQLQVATLFRAPPLMASSRI
ncbi:hypothetical protein CHLNCDRAFT_30937 [Chlorella variabilis]|uniref:PDZ domain-containing protein n=1 Tax=Chlorella variabilis TaxID=554065 RepID=E1ZDZ6_CHLVA|nr:hypothetical protein CHLNCDRAFT_30937 [Chlorella variabilis]EFN55782.1 hypothetical protein CHLNCDRAFT_30937 [Chlorella variabilis]|eukprot:XP_005847884.1 hypothetical protein CHLNCDRAFT_30937 [Chlorella variabilis]